MIPQTFEIKSQKDILCTYVCKVCMYVPSKTTIFSCLEKNVLTAFVKKETIFLEEESELSKEANLSSSFWMLL